MGISRRSRNYAILARVDSRAIRVLEFNKIRERLSSYTAFSLGAERALALMPTDDPRLAA